MINITDKMVLAALYASKPGANAYDRNEMNLMRATITAALSVATPPAPQRHPDALEDGSLSKSTAKRVDALRMAQGADEFTLSAEDLAVWLDRKYARHGEDEDRQAAAMLRKLSTQPPHQDRGEVEQRAREILFATAGSEFAETLAGQMSGGGDPAINVRFALRAITAALTEAKQQGQGEAESPSLKQTPAWWVGYPIGPTGRAPYHCIGPDMPASRYANESVHWIPLYTAPQVEAKRQTGGDAFVYWATQAPGMMPRLYGIRAFAEINWHPEEGHDLIGLQVIERIAAAAKPSGEERS